MVAIKSFEVILRPLRSRACHCSMKPFQQIFSRKKTKLQGQVFECPEMDETFFFDLKATPHVFKGENKNDFMTFKFDPNVRVFTGIVRWKLPHNDRIAESWFQFQFTEDYLSVENVQRKNYDAAKQHVDPVWKNKNLVYEYIQPKTNKNEKWRTFDISLEECPTISGIPRVLYICCSAIERRPDKCLGVYRAPGNRQLQERLIKVLNNKRHKTQSIKEHVNACDSRTLASLVIDFVRRLPQPVLPDSFLESCSAILAMEDDIEQIRSFRSLLAAIPKINFNTIDYLSYHFHLVSSFDASKMDPFNLSVCFSAHLFRRVSSTNFATGPEVVQAAKTLQIQCEILYLFISRYPFIFTSDALPASLPAEYANNFKRNNFNTLMEML